VRRHRQEQDARSTLRGCNAIPRCVVLRGPASDANAEILSDVFGRVRTIDAGDYAILTARW
jgi:hypothetical protein